MAIDVGELLVKISTDISDLKKGLEDANAKVASFGATTVAKGNLIADAIKEAGKVILRFGKDSLLAFGESQEAVTRLELALRNSGQEVENNSRRLQNNATALQKLTGVSDEAILGSQSLLISFGLAGAELDKTTKAALDLSKGLGIDLRAATMLLGKAAVGETATLARYGLVIDEATPKSKRFEAALSAVNQRFGGQAQANIDGVNGKIAVLTQRLNDAQEKIGQQLVPALDFWGNALSKLLDLIDKTTASEDKEAKGRNLTIQRLRQERIALLDNAKARGSYRNGVILLSAAEQRRLQVITNAINREKQLLQEGLDAQVEVNAQKTADNEQTELRKKLLAEQMAKERKEAEEKEAEETKKRNELRAANWRDTLNFISSLAQEKNKTLAAIGKAAAISTAIIDTHSGIGKAWSLGPIVGPPMAAMVAAAGFANVARIAGVKLAKGGMVLSREGGTQAIIGEGGRDEAVLPLEDDRTSDMLGDALEKAGAGGRSLVLNFNISGQFIEGSEAKLQNMLRKAILPEIRRYSEVSPQSSFIRRRGQR